MEPSFNFLSILNLLGVGQAALFAFALAGTRRGGTRPNRLLAALLLVLAVVLTWNILLHTRYLFRVPHLTQLHVPLQFLIGPLVYLYLRSQLDRERPLRSRDLLHLLPAIVCALYLAPFYMQSGAYKAEFLRAAFESYPFEWRVRTTLVLLTGGAYLLFSLRLPGLLPRKMGGGVAVRASKEDLFWARAWTFALALALFVGYVRFVFDYSVRSNLFVPLIFTLSINAAVYLRLRRADVRAETHAATPDSASPAKKYEKSTLTPVRAARYEKRLVELVEAEKLYTDGDLTLQRLAEKLSISSQHLSQVINERLGQSFTDFVNSYRVREAKLRLADSKRSHLSILAIAESVGFNSKSAFNAVFKKHTGMTPSEWRNSHAQISGRDQQAKAAGDA